VSVLLVVGAGGHARVLVEAAIESGVCTDIVFFDDRYPEVSELDGYKVIGATDDLATNAQLSRKVAVAIGDNRRRVGFIRTALERGFECPVIVHPSATVSSAAEIGDGTLVLAGGVVAIGSLLGIGCIANHGSTIDHDCRLGDGVHVAPGAHLAGAVNIGRFSWVGIGATVNQAVSIGANVTIGASAAVIRDVPNDSTWVGVPARPVES